MTRYILESRDEPGRYYVSDYRALSRAGHHAIRTTDVLSEAMWWEFASLALITAATLPGRWKDVAVTAEQMQPAREAYPEDQTEAATEPAA